ncbi:WG repeat-containing protein [Saccharicrinis aurantiacus]|uniref:WG repeat-containing protein n=1 Tax=Saccharicrinis aurantiacus TaxID=1849719 RepID=UPI0024905EDD|nr:WG repeat-containing protein [Saccharicrinis aurantiacus]
MNRNSLQLNLITLVALVLNIFFTINISAQEYPLPYKTSNGYLYINEKGKTEIKEKFKCAYHFINNIAIVQGGNKRDFLTGAIDNKGKVIIPFYYNEISECGELLAARKGDNYAFYNKNSELLLGLQDSISPFDIKDGFVRNYRNGDYSYYHIASKRYFTSKTEINRNYPSIYRLGTNQQDYIFNINHQDYFCAIDTKVYQINVMPFCNEEIVLVKKSDRWAILNITNNECSEFIYTAYKAPSKNKMYIEGINNETRHLYNKKGVFLDSLPFTHENYQTCYLHEQFQVQSYGEYKTQYSELIAPSGEVLLTKVNGIISPIMNFDGEPTFTIKSKSNSNLIYGIFRPSDNKIVQCKYHEVFFDNKDTMYFNNNVGVSGCVKWGSTDTIYFENKKVVDMVKGNPIFLDKDLGNQLGRYILDENGNKQKCNVKYKSEKEFETMIALNVDKSYYLLNSDLKVISDNYKSITRKQNENFPGKDYFIAALDSSSYLLDSDGNKQKLPSYGKWTKYTVYPYNTLPVLLVESGKKKHLVHMKTMELLFEADNISVMHTSTDKPFIWIRNKSEDPRLYIGAELLSSNKSIRNVSKDPVCYLYEDEGKTMLIDNDANIYPIDCQAIAFDTKDLFILRHHKTYDKEKLYSVFIKKSGKQIFFKTKPIVLESDKLIIVKREGNPYYFTFNGEVLFDLNN